MIASRLQQIADGRQWSTLTPFLDGLSHAQFRTAGYLLGEELMPKLSAEDFWMLHTLLYNYKAKAFLVTGMKAARDRVGEFRSEPAERLWRQIAQNEIDATKTLETILPAVPDDPELCQYLANLMLIGKSEKLVAILLRIDTPASAFLMLHVLRQLEHDRPLLVKAVCFLMKRGDSHSFNLASFYKSFFGLDEVRGIFSLNLQPFELSRLETNYEAFKQKIWSV